MVALRFMLEVSCVIVSFDSERFLLRCVESLLHTTPNAISIIIVDNGPKESFSNYLCESLNSMGFTVVPYVGNRGFGAACNAGIAASVTNTPILLVNPDAVVSVDDIAYLSDVLARQPAFGIVGPVLTLSDRSHVVNGGSFPSLAHLIRSKFGRRRQARLDPHPGSVAVNDRECLRMDWVSGAVMMIRREAWDAVGASTRRFSSTTRTSTSVGACGPLGGKWASFQAPPPSMRAVGRNGAPAPGPALSAFTLRVRRTTSVSITAGSWSGYYGYFAFRT